jgi:hypothetical protein
LFQWRCESAGIQIYSNRFSNQHPSIEGPERWFSSCSRITGDGKPVTILLGTEVQEDSRKQVIIINLLDTY